MVDVEGDLWTYRTEGISAEYCAVCITTNGNVIRGKNIMGAGCAGEAAERFPELPTALGSLIKKYGNRVFAWPPYQFDESTQPWWLFTLPTKEEVREPSTMKRVARSIYELKWFVEGLDCIEEVIIPRPGTGLGGLNYDVAVGPFLRKTLDNRFKVITFPPVSSADRVARARAGAADEVFDVEADG